MSIKKEKRSSEELAERYKRDTLEKLRFHTVKLLEIVPSEDTVTCKDNIKRYDGAIDILLIRNIKRRES